MDISLYCSEAGAGFPLILLHGNGEDHTYFREQALYFSKYYRVIALDTRGHGQSPRGTAPFSLTQFAADLKEFMDQKQISRAHLLGFSDGANIALLFALNFPERVEKLILNGGNLNPRGVKLHIQLPILLGWACTRLFRHISPQALANYEMLNLMVTQPHLSGVQLSVLTAPVLVIAGDKDMIRETHTRLITDSLPNSRLCILRGDHFIAAKNSREFNRAVAGFLNETSENDGK